MKVIKNKTIDFATAVQAPVINGNRAARTGYVRLVHISLTSLFLNKLHIREKLS